MKKTSLLLAALLLVVSLAGCQPEGGQTGSDTDSSSSSSSEAFTAYPFEYDPYVLPSVVKEQLGDKFESYKKVVDAVRGREERVPLADQRTYDAVIGVLEEYYPPYALVSEARYDVSAGEAALSYRYNQTIHEQRASSFETSQQFASTISLKEGDSVLARALSLYYYTTSSIYEGDRETTPLEPFLASVADHDGYAIFLNQMFLQVGLDSFLVEVTDANQQKHKMVMLALDGSFYYFDPYSERAVTSGHGLVCFGMTDKDRDSIGFGESARLLTGTNANATVPAANNDRFSEMRLCASWTMDNERQNIILTVEGVQKTWGPLDEK